jgi:hypothetical protein
MKTLVLKCLRLLDICYFNSLNKSSCFSDEGAILAVEQYTRPRLRISEDSLDPEVAHGGKRHKTRQLCHHFTEDEKKAAGKAYTY